MNTSKDNVVIVGLGEIGKAMKEICNEHNYNTFVVEKDYADENIPKKSIMLVNIPFNDAFIPSIEKYSKNYDPKFIIINSTIGLGTTRKIENLIKIPTVHSPVRGKHPKLNESIKTFVKFIGATNKENAKTANDFFESMKVPTMLFNSPEETEMTKLLDTTTYAVHIAWATEVKKICDEHGLNFENVFTHANKTYNDGYQKLGMGHYTRPVLQPCEGKFGGHCVGPNAKILDKKLGKFKNILDDFI